MSVGGRLELLVEPFHDGAPGPHVLAVLDALRTAGLDPDMGPFATSVEAPMTDLHAAVPACLAAGFAAGATSIQVRVETVSHVRTAELHGALERLVGSVEREIGTPLAEMDRAQKQRAVRRLDEQGAFLLRGAVEEVAGWMGVSRVTLYSYLNTRPAD